jgi:hypothetical protein
MSQKHRQNAPKSIRAGIVIAARCAVTIGAMCAAGNRIAIAKNHQLLTQPLK